MDAYKASLRDPKLLNLRDSIAMFDAIAKRAAERAVEADTPEFRKRAIEMQAEVQDAVDAGDDDRMKQSLFDLGLFLRSGAAEDSAMRHLSEALENYSKRAEKVHSLQLAKNVAIPAHELMIILSRLAEVITRTAPREVAIEVLAEIDRVTATQPQRGADTDIMAEAPSPTAISVPDSDDEPPPGGIVDVSVDEDAVGRDTATAEDPAD